MEQGLAVGLWLASRKIAPCGENIVVRRGNSMSRGSRGVTTAREKTLDAWHAHSTVEKSFSRVRMRRLRLLSPESLGRLALLAVLIFSLFQLEVMKPPSKTAWAKHLAQDKDPTVAEHVQVGMWYGAMARAA